MDPLAVAADAAALPAIRLFGLDIRAARFDDAAAHLLALAASAPDKQGARIVVTPNVDHLVRLDADPGFKQLYERADYIFADGMPVVWASRFASQRLPERVTGADLFVALAKGAQARGLGIFVIGGMPGQEVMLLARFAQVYPGLKVDIFCPSMKFDALGAEGQEAQRLVNLARPAMVFVCLGMPKQEHWAHGWRASLDTRLIMCFGAAMEFALGFKSRAPLWMQRAGLEWSWRLMSEPRRLWRRYIVQGAGFGKLLRREIAEQRRLRERGRK